MTSLLKKLFKKFIPYEVLESVRILRKPVIKQKTNQISSL